LLVDTLNPFTNGTRVSRWAWGLAFQVSSPEQLWILYEWLEHSGEVPASDIQ